MKKILLLVAFCFVFKKSFSIIYWQPYPITVIIDSIGTQHRLECSVFDSLLGSWQYYNTPYFNSSINTSGSSSTIIVFATYHPPYTFDLDTIYGYIIYDQELHQFMPVIKSYYDPDVPGAVLGSFDGCVTVLRQCCYDASEAQYLHLISGYLYDINTHSWVAGAIDGDYQAINLVQRGGLINSFLDNDIDYALVYSYFYDPVFHNFVDYGNGGIDANNFGGNQDLYYIFDLPIYAGNSAWFAAFDPKLHIWKYWENNTAHPGQYHINNGIFHTYHFNSGENYFGIYDDSLHQWKIDSTSMALSNVKIKDHVVAYTNTAKTKFYFEVFSPTSRTWVKDSSSVPVGIDSIYIVNGTVKCRNNNGALKKFGYNDTTGWGNFDTPLLLNYHLTDFYSSTGLPLVFVRNYSIGTGSVNYDFGDGITTNWSQYSLWHQYKVNGHYAPAAVNYNICIYANTPQGIQSSCQTIIQPCSATFNITSNCPGSCNGSIAALPQTGQAPFSFLWSTGATSSSINSLCAGNYTVTIVDNSGCSITSNAVLNPMIVTSTPNAITCPGSCNASIYATASAGIIPYTYLWSNGNTTSSLSNLCTGSYTVTVTDGNNCTKSAVSVVSNPGNPATLNSFIYTCPSCSTCNDGEIDYVTAGGTPPFTFLRNPNIGILDTVSISLANWDYLPIGIYTMTETDANGCSVSVTDTLEELMAQIIPNGPTTFCVGGSVLLTANSNANSYYQWLKNSNYISGAYSQTYLATTAGMYQVKVGQPGSYVISAPIAVTVPCGPIIDPNQKTGNDISEENNPELFVSYNPLVQTLFVDAQYLQGKNYTLHVYDIIGKEVYKEEGAVTQSGNESLYKKELNMALFSKGIYAVMLQTEHDRLVKKFVKD